MKPFKEVIDGIRKAVMASEVREDLAQMGEYVEQFANTAGENIQKAIDPTLSLSGKAADAAKVGEAVGTLKEDLFGIKAKDITFKSKLELGNNNGFIDNNGQLNKNEDFGMYYSDFINVISFYGIKAKIRATDATNAISFYDSSKKYISGIDTHGQYSYIDIEIPKNAIYARFTSTNEDSAPFNKLSIIIYRQENNNANIYINDKTKLKLQTFAIDTNGVYNNNFNTNYFSSEYLNVENAQLIKVQTSAENNYNAISFYDKHKKYISGVVGSDQTEYYEYNNKLLPIGTKFIAITTNSNYFELSIIRSKTEIENTGNFVEQSKSKSDIFSNDENRNIYFRKSGNIWQRNFENVIVNPVLKPNCPDPSYIKVDDYFYLFFSGKPCYIYKSKDMANWEICSQVFSPNFDFSVLPNMAEIWANDINKIGNKYVNYISIWTGSNTTTYTIAMTADNIEGPYEYAGVVIPSFENGGPVKQPIDAEYCTDGSSGYLIFGSPDCYIVKLTTDGLSTDGDYIHIGSTTGEGSYLYLYKNYYYLFNSFANWQDYSYNVRISRSENITGPYINKDGESLLTDGVFGSRILHSDDGDTLYGAGHNGEIYKDLNGNMFILLHCHIKGVTFDDINRPLIIMRIKEDSNGWLAFADKDGNIADKPTWECSVPKVN